MIPKPAHRFQNHRALLIAVLLALPFVGLAGCGGVKGTYTKEEKTGDGEMMAMTLELKGGDKAVMSMKGGPGGAQVMTVEGTYTVDGDKVTVVLAGDKSVFTLKDGNLTTKMMGDEIVLVKQ